MILNCRNKSHLWVTATDKELRKALSPQLHLGSDLLTDLRCPGAKTLWPQIRYGHRFAHYRLLSSYLRLTEQLLHKCTVLGTRESTRKVWDCVFIWCQKSGSKHALPQRTLFKKKKNWQHRRTKRLISLSVQEFRTRTLLKEPRKAGQDIANKENDLASLMTTNPWTSERVTSDAAHKPLPQTSPLGHAFYSSSWPHYPPIIQ